MSEYINKSQDVTVLMYHLVFPAKYRRIIFDEQVGAALKDVCLGVAERYQVRFLEIGTDKDHAVCIPLKMGNYPAQLAITATC